MIKYLELTAPESNEFRQSKIVKVLVNVDDRVEIGDALFIVQSRDQEIELPATMAGKIVEVIALEGENISVLTPLVLLETEVEGSTATPPINGDADKADTDGEIAGADESESAAQPATPKKKKKKKSKKKGKKKKSAKSIADPQPEPKAPASPRKKVMKNSKIAETLEKAAKTRNAQQDLDLSVEEMPEATPKVSTENNTTQPSAPEQSTMSNVNVTVPDIGTDSAKVVEILVSVGDTVAIDDPLVTLESDKASMELPSTHAGTVTAILVSQDEDVSEGSLVVELSSGDAATQATDSAHAPAPAPAPAPAAAPAPAPEPEQAPAPASATSTVSDVAIPDIGGDTAKVIEILVNVGQEVALEDPLITLESDKASMEVPSTAAGVIESIEVELDQEVGEGVVVVKLATQGAGAVSAASASAPAAAPAPVPAPEQAPAPAPAPAAPAQPVAQPALDGSKSHASPSVRRFARELGATLAQINGSGRKGRITKDDVKAHVKGILTKPVAAAAGGAPSQGAGIEQVPAVDFSKFGEIDVQPLNKIKRLTASNLHRSWLNVPHVTHNDESNISDLESFRKQLNAEYAKQGRGIKLSPLAFIVKAVVNAMQAYPQFNSSLEPGGENLIYKKYFNIGIAVETPNGLVVPVVKDADKMSVAEIAAEMGELASKARDKKLSMADMSGACFTISSLGGIGGTGFTPIVNAPEVAILGVSRSKIEPVWDGENFQPGMILPLSLSYDHRVIDGAEAARFTRHIAAVLEDVRRLTV